MTAADLPMPILEVVLRTGAVTSKKEAKRLVDGIARFSVVDRVMTHVLLTGGGLIWAGAGVMDSYFKVAAADFKDGLSVLRVGKKRAYIVRLKSAA